jgi:uncharacterized membrane protein
LVLAGLVFVFSASVRFYGLGEQSLDCEEFYTLVPAAGHDYRAQSKAKPLDVPLPVQEYRGRLTARSEDGSETGLADVTDVLRRDVHLPGYFYFMHFWIKAFGISEWALRLPSALFGVLSVVVFFFLGSRLFDPSVGFLGALLMAAMPDQVYYSQEARMYSLLVLLLVSSTYAITLAEQRPSSVWPYALYAILSVCGLYTHYVYLFCFGFQSIFVWVGAWNGRWRIHRWLISQLAVILAFSPWTFVALAQKRAASGTLAWARTGSTDISIPGELLIQFTSLISVPELPLGLLSVIIGYSLLMLGIVSVRSKQPILCLLGLWIGIPIIGILTLDQLMGTQGIRVARYWLVITPALYLLMSVGVDTIKSRYVRLTLVSILGLLLCVSAIWTTTGRIRKKPDDYKQLTRYIERQLKESDEGIVLTDGMRAIPFALGYYGEGPMTVWQVNLPAKEHGFREAIKDKSALWLIAPNENHAKRALHQMGFRLGGRPRDFGHIFVYRFILPKDAADKEVTLDR